MSVLRRWTALCCLSALCAVAGCDDQHRGQEPSHEAPSVSAVTSSRALDEQMLAALRGFEASQREDRAWLAERPIDARGSDPYRLLATRLDGVNSYWGLLRRASRLVELDPRGEERASYPAPAGALALATGDGRILIAGELSAELLMYPLAGSPSAAKRLGAAERLRVVTPAVLRGLAYLGGAWYGTEELSGQLVRLSFRRAKQAAAGAPRTVDLTPVAACRGGLQVEATAHWLVANCLLDHRLLIYSAEQLSEPQPGQAQPRRFQLDGPLWGFALWEHQGGLAVAAGGVEDAPLDRSIGSFGNIDSFVYSLNVSASGIRKTGQVNVSELGLVLPKALLVSGSGATRQLRIAGYATPGLLRAEWTPDGLSKLELRDRLVPPGTAAMLAADAELLLANPLLDTWLSLSDDGELIAAPPLEAASDTRSWRARLGEALFFTTLMAPQNRSTGKLSRFTCETCHFEGQTDGRVHATGRGAIHATTKSLVGLQVNRPYFTRALDPDLARMVHSEFRVAGANSGSDPRFALTLSEASWVRQLGVPAPRVEALELRQALLEFLVHFNHGPHPGLAQREQPSVFSARERRGAQLFGARCESCHQARRVADDPGSRVAPNDWLQELSANSGLVWARDGYEQTGVLPYVHPLGARPSSLRRLYKKAPYFTNGAAETLEKVLSKFAFQASGSGREAARAAHLGAPPEWARLSADEQADLLAFLGVL